MKTRFSLLLLALLASALGGEIARAADPLRVFIRAGKKSHGPGAHDYPRFLAQWKPLLEARGAVVDGALEFPTARQLENTDVLVLHSQEAGNIAVGSERNHLETFLKRGGGLVVIHGGAVSRDDPDWYKTIIGGSWRFGTTKWLEAPMSLYFTDRENAITRDISNFELEDEIYYDMDLRDDIEVLAAAYTPKAIDTGGKGNREAQALAAKAVAEHKAVNIYDIQPQIWTYERTIKGGGTPYRAFVHIPGHWQRNFSHNGIRTMLLRGIAWAGKRRNIDEFCKPEELGDALRYVEGGAPRPGKLPDYLEVHPDFELSLVASEPLINNPMNIDWDEKGRLWVVETPEYPNGLRRSELASWIDSGSVVRGVYDRDPLDRISILSDTDGDGVMDEKKVFADKMELVTSSVFYQNGVIACSAPDIWYLQDTDGDDVADTRTKLYAELGTRDTHAVINNMRWGRDGWVYATHGYSSSDNVTSGDGKTSFGPVGMGVVRFLPDGSAFEQYASRGGNTWGLETTLEGEVFYTQPTTGNPLVHVVLPEYILARGKLPGISGTNGLLPGEPTFPAMHWEQIAYVQIDQVGRYTAGAGTVIYQGGAWPKKWNMGYFTTEPTLNIVSHFKLEPDGVTYRATREAGREQTEFIRSSNLWFRPIEVRTGPDGALYIVDFCNQAVIHNDTRGPVHGPANAAVRPDRDHYYGRIWRVQHKKATTLPALDLDPTDLAALEEAATSPNKHTKETAWRLLREEHGAEPLAVGSSAVLAYEKALATKDPSAFFELVRAAQDDWTLSALVAAASERAPALVIAALEQKPDAQILAFTAALAPAAIGSANGRDNANLLLKACAEAGPAALPLVETVLFALADSQGDVPPFSPGLKASLEILLEDSATASLALPLAAAWDKKRELSKTTDALIEDLLGDLVNTELAVTERAGAAHALVRFRGSKPAVLKPFEKILAGKDTPAIKREIIATLGAAEGLDPGRILVLNYTKLPPALRAAAFEQILKRPARANRFLALIEEGRIKGSDLGPGDLARLRTHPAKGVARHAQTVLARFNPINPARAELIASLSPEILKPGGDPTQGKLLFMACAVCHQ
ncbi:MAG: PVC-type heme-binding CxxCH protein, partial [Verrucomicrobiales bacterium]